MQDEHREALKNIQSTIYNFLALFGEIRGVVVIDRREPYVDFASGENLTSTGSLYDWGLCVNGFPEFLNNAEGIEASALFAEVEKKIDRILPPVSTARRQSALVSALEMAPGIIPALYAEPDQIPNSFTTINVVWYGLTRAPLSVFFMSAGVPSALVNDSDVHHILQEVSFKSVIFSSLHE